MSYFKSIYEKGLTARQARPSNRAIFFASRLKAASVLEGAAEGRWEDGMALDAVSETGRTRDLIDRGAQRYSRSRAASTNAWSSDSL